MNIMAGAKERAFTRPEKEIDCRARQGRIRRAALRVLAGRLRYYNKGDANVDYDGGTRREYAEGAGTRGHLLRMRSRKERHTDNRLLTRRIKCVEQRDSRSININLGLVRPFRPSRWCAHFHPSTNWLLSHFHSSTGWLLSSSRSVFTGLSRYRADAYTASPKERLPGKGQDAE